MYIFHISSISIIGIGLLKMIQDNDWRLQGQESYLNHITLYWKKYTPYRESWDHDHCEFCWEKFCLCCPDSLKEGYATKDNYWWICDQCFEDFKEMFEWNVGDLD